MWRRRREVTEGGESWSELALEMEELDWSVLILVVKEKD